LKKKLDCPTVANEYEVCGHRSSFLESHQLCCH